MNPQTKLERSILDAHASGDRVRLEALQEEFRAGGFVTRVSAPGSVGLVERTASRSSTQSRSTGLRMPGRGAAAILPVPAGNVVITALAADGVRDLSLDTGFEEGGFCFGEYSGDDIVVWKIVRGVERQSADVVRLDTDVIEQWEDRLRLERWVAVGDWHSHVAPGAVSQGDRRAWLAMSTEYARPWCGLLFTPRTRRFSGETDWLFGPDITAFIAEPGRTMIASAREVIVERGRFDA